MGDGVHPEHAGDAHEEQQCERERVDAGEAEADHGEVPDEAGDDDDPDDAPGESEDRDDYAADGESQAENGGHDAETDGSDVEDLGGVFGHEGEDGDAEDVVGGVHNEQPRKDGRSAGVGDALFEALVVGGSVFGFGRALSPLCPSDISPASGGNPSGSSQGCVEDEDCTEEVYGGDYCVCQVGTGGGDDPSDDYGSGHLACVLSHHDERGGPRQ